MFKEMTATYTVTNTNNEKTKYFIGDRIEVKRILSPCTSYGDRSSHIISDLDREVMPNCYDTRYDCITTEEEEWASFWKEFVEKKTGLELKLIELKSKLNLEEEE